MLSPPSAEMKCRGSQYDGPFLINLHRYGNEDKYEGTWEAGMRHGNGRCAALCYCLRGSYSAPSPGTPGRLVDILMARGRRANEQALDASFIQTNPSLKEFGQTTSQVLTYSLFAVFSNPSCSL